MVNKMEQIFKFKESSTRISNAANLFDNIKEFNIDYTQENVLLFVFDSKQEIIHSEVVFKGGLNMCIIDPKTIFRKALEHNGNSIIIAHNHPSGNIEPSTEDLKGYKMLKDGGNILKISVIDSIVFNKTEYYSMHNEGI